MVNYKLIQEFQKLMNINCLNIKIEFKIRKNKIKINAAQNHNELFLHIIYKILNCTYIKKFLKI